MQPPATPIDSLIPVSLLDQVNSLAAAEHRSAGDVVREALEVYLQDHPLSGHSGTRTASDAAARIRERRKFRPMPEGMTIREMIDYGRA